MNRSAFASRRRTPAPAIVAVLFAAGCQGAGTPDAVTAVDPVERGRYLVTTGSCNDCHTPWTMGPAGPAPDPARLLSGHPADDALPDTPLPEGWGMLMSPTNTAFRGPWGTSYAANLTPDDTGLGTIEVDHFIQAMRTGKHFGSGPGILPPMPWPSLAAMTDEDLRAVWAYLRSIPPIENSVPDATPPAGAPAP